MEIKKLEAVYTSEGKVKAVGLEDGAEIEADAWCWHLVLGLGSFQF